MSDFYNKLENQSSYGLRNLSDLGYSIDSILINCKFQEKECFSTDFFMYHSYFYGNCFSFNIGLKSSGQSVPIKVSNKPGWRHGLQVELDVGDPRNSLKLSYKSGFRIVIHNKTEKVFPEEDGFSVQTGVETNVAVSRTFVTRLSKPYSDCMRNFFYFKNIESIKLFEKYF